MSDAAIQDQLDRKYEHGWTTDIESDTFPPGLNEDVVRAISAKKGEPEWLTEWRLKAYRHWLTMTEPSWQKPHYPPIDYQAYSYFSAPKKDEDRPQSLDEVDPKLLETYEKLGIPLAERAALAGVAVDAVFDSVSVATTFREELKAAGVIFMSFSEAVHEHPELIKKYLGSVVPIYDNYFAALNSAVFSDGSFVFVPKGTRCPMELSTYFRINEMNTGQFERTLIVVEDGAYVSYLEGCTAPMRDENQLHAAVVELVAEGDGEIKYSTVQNWYPGDENGKGGIYNFVTKRGICKGDRSKISWTQVETGSAITWKYPSVILKGDHSVGEFYSVAVTNNRQQADTGTKMIHLGKNTKSTIISKGISRRPLRPELPRPGAREQEGRARPQLHPVRQPADRRPLRRPHVPVHRGQAHPRPRWSTRPPPRKVSDEQIFYLQQRGISEEDAVNLIVNGFCKDVFQQAPDGVRRRGPEAPGRQPRRARSAEPRPHSLPLPLFSFFEVHVMLEIREPPRHRPGHPGPQGHQRCPSPKGEVHAIMGPNGSGKSTLSKVLAGDDSYEVTQGTISWDGEDLLELDPHERAAAGVFLGFQYPVEVPGVSNAYFLRTALNAQRKQRGEDEISAPKFLKALKENMAFLEMDAAFRNRFVNVGFSGGEKKRNEILQLLMLDPSLAILDETDSGLDIDALRVVGKGVNKLRDADHAIVLITHYQRLLDHIEPDVVHVLMDGKIVTSGDKSLALTLEEQGYAAVRPAV